MKKIIRKIARKLRPFASDFWHNCIAASFFCPAGLRAALYRASGNKIGNKCRLSPHLFLGYGPGRLHVGGGHL